MEKPKEVLAGAVLTLLLMAFVLVPLVLIPAAARADGARPYVGVQAGMFLPIESGVGAVPAGLEGKLTFNPGFVLAALGGYEFGNGIRGEGEFNFRRITADRLFSSGPSVQVDSDIWSCGFMANLYYDIRTRTAVTPFLGAGLGLAVVNFGKGTSNGTTLWDSGRDTAVAYQAIAGFAVALSRQTSLDFVYHHYATPTLHFDTLSSQYKGINLSAGIRHHF